MHPSEWGEEGQFHHLMASQQRDLRNQIENQFELDEDDFLLRLGDGRWAGIISGNVRVPVMTYEPEQFFFSLTHLEHTGHGYGFNPGGHAIYFKPGEQTSDERHMQLEWRDVRRYFGKWLGYIARELDLANDPALQDDDDIEDEEYDEDDEPERGDKWYGEYESYAKATPTPRVVVSPEPDPDPPVAEDVDEPEWMPATPLKAASTPTPDVPPRALPPPSWFQRASDWARVQKEKHGILWGMIAFVVVLIVTIVAALL